MTNTKTIAALLLMTSLAACAATAKPPAYSSAAAPTAIARLAVHRAQALQWLHEYALSNSYPKDATGMPVSEFQDERGVRCPMAELIHRSGHDELVAMVVRTDNQLRLADVHAGPLHDWMLDSGLTVAEIAMVQGALTPAEEAMMFDGTQLAKSIVVRRAAADGQVRGRLATAEIALRDATPHSLDDAVAAAATAAATAAKPALISRR